MKKCNCPIGIGGNCRHLSSAGYCMEERERKVYP
jgi:hypothetical protein